MNQQEYIDWALNLFANNPKINRFNIVLLRPEDYPRFPKGERNTAWAMNRRDAVIDSIVEGDELLCPYMTEEEFSKTNVEKFLADHPEVCDATLFFGTPNYHNKKNERKIGIFIIDRNR